jgi:hypothetical protein
MLRASCNDRPSVPCSPRTFPHEPVRLAQEGITFQLDATNALTTASLHAPALLRWKPLFIKHRRRLTASRTRYDRFWRRLLDLQPEPNSGHSGSSLGGPTGAVREPWEMPIPARSRPSRSTRIADAGFTRMAFRPSFAFAWAPVCQGSCPADMACSLLSLYDASSAASRNGRVA